MDVRQWAKERKGGEGKKETRTEKRCLMQESWNQSSQAAHWTILALRMGSYGRSHQQKRPMKLWL